MSTIVTPEALYFGAPASLLIDDVEMGATLDNPKVGFDITMYKPIFKNAGGPVKGAARVRGVVPKLTCLVNELSAAKIAHAMPGSASTVGTATETVAGIDTTLAAASDVGDTTIALQAGDGALVTTALGAGAVYLRVGIAGETEIHRVVSVLVDVIGLDAPLFHTHRADDQVRQTDDAGTALFTWTLPNIDDSAYFDVQAIGVGADGRELRAKIKNALAGDSFEFTMGDADFYGVPMVFYGNYDPTTPQTVPYELEVG